MFPAPPRPLEKLPEVEPAEEIVEDLDEIVWRRGADEEDVALVDGLYMFPAPPRPQCMYALGRVVGAGSMIE